MKESRKSLSKAHAQSESCIVDPAYCSTKPAPCESAPFCDGYWVYGDGELESYRLSVLRKAVRKAKLNVWYPGKYYSSTSKGSFRIPISELPLSDGGKQHYLRFKCNDGSEVKVYLSSDDEDERENCVLYQADTGDDVHVVEIKDDERTYTHLNVSVDACTRIQNENDDELVEPPALFIYNSSDSSDLGSETDFWEWSSADKSGEGWSKCLVLVSSPDNAPHAAQEPSILMEQPKSLNVSGDPNLFDFNIEIYGRVIIKYHIKDGNGVTTESDVAPAPPRLFVGESVKEAMDDDLSHQEQSTELTKITGAINHENNLPSSEGTETWVSAHLLAFRHVRIDVPHGASAISVACEASFRPVQYKGAFASSDPILDKIWMHSAYTLRSCMHHDFLLDGMKRDRLPWAGDLAISLLSNAYTFADASIVARSLTVLGRAGIAEKDINGFIDYSLWWIICSDLYQTYFGDMQFLHREWNRISLAIESLLSRCDHRGLLTIDEETRKDIFFIDWVDVEKMVPLQVLWWWALDRAVSIADRVGCSKSATKWSLLRDEVRNNLLDLFWDENAGLWRASLDDKGDFSRHACILSVVSGLTDEKNAGKIVEALLQDDSDDLVSNMRAVATPYMKIFECLALSKTGSLHFAFDRMRQFWSAMLNDGASTFYEAYSISDSDGEKMQTSFYGRPFGNSLCHAWSSGPCSFISGTIFGVRPLSDGWKTWTCRTELPPNFDCAALSVPTPHGPIEIEFNFDNSFNISVPSETTLLVDGKDFVGPQKLILPSFQPDPSKVIGTRTIAEWSRPYRNWNYFPHLVIPAEPKIPGYEGVHMTDVPTIYQIPEEDNKNKWYMSFIGFDGNGYQSFVAESSDLVNWTKFRLAFGFGDEGDFDFGGRVLGGYLLESYDVNAPKILKKLKGKFWCLYGAYSKRGGYEIDPGFEGVCVSEDGITWCRAVEHPILSVNDGDTMPWESGSIYQPWLLHHDGMFYNYYNAKRMPEWLEQIGVATSKDLIDWKRSTDNPIVKVLPGNFDSQFCSDPKVYRDGDHWIMFYFGLGKEGKASIMVAFSRDLLHWTKDKSPLYLAGGHPKNLDNQHAHKTSLVYNASNKTYYLYYCAVGSKGRGIGLVTSRALCDA